MEDLSDILSPETVRSDVQAANKKALFVQLGSLGSRATGLDARLIVERLSDREKLGSTGFGGGVAIPHGRMGEIDRVHGLFVRLAQPIGFEAVDSMPVDIVLALLSPPDAGVEHLKALARVSRRLRDRGFVAKLRGAGSDDALFALLSGGETRHAA